MKRFLLIVTFIGRGVALLITLLTVAYAASLLRNSVTELAGAFSVSARYNSVRGGYPSTATQLAVVYQEIGQTRTAQPSNTPTPTETFEPGVEGGPVIGGDTPMLDPTPTTPPPVSFYGAPPELASLNRQIQFVTDTPIPPGALATNTKRPTSTLPATTPTLQVSATLPPVTGAPIKVPTVPLLQIPTVSRPQRTAIPTPMARLRVNNADILNVILIGSDQDVDPSDRSFRTDSMLVVSINRTNNIVSMLSLPRDLYVYIPTLGMARLNTAYGWGEQVGFKPEGGFGLLKQTVLYNFGIPIHYYARISLDGFKSIIDLLGGIDVAVDCPISDLRYQGPVSERTPQPNEYTPFTLNPGYYRMNGSLSLWYARSRKSTSDFDRGRRQQQVLRAIWKTAREQNLAAKIVELWGPVTGVMVTDLTLADVLSLLPTALSLEPGNVRSFYMNKGYELQHFAADGSDVQLPLLPGYLETLNRFYTPPTANKTAGEAFSIEITNGTDRENLDKVAADRLLWSGFGAVTKGKGDLTAKTIVYDYTGNAKPATLTALVKALNVKNTQIQSQPDPNRTVDFRIVLGTDYNSCSAPGFAK